MTAAVFLDRDDTLIPSSSFPTPPPPCAHGDVIDPAIVVLIPGVLESCRNLKRTGMKLVMVTNQSVVARGGATLDQVEAVNARVRALLDGLIDATYYCPFHPHGTVPRFTGEHPWRKPAPGMLLAAAAELSLDLPRSWLIGDADRDIEAGRAAGLAPDHCLQVGPARSFASAAETILRTLSLTR